MSSLSKTVGVVQSNYIPWKGYFDIINDVDLFVFHDDLRYTKNDWRNRNRIMSSNGPAWLTIPVGTKQDRLICDVKLPDTSWNRKHWARIQQAYSNAPYFDLFRDFFEEIYLASSWTYLSELNQFLVKAISTELLGIDTEFADSRDFGVSGHKTDRLLDLLRLAGATRYVSGPSARSYIDRQRFEESGIDLVYKDYDGYPEYAQHPPPFEHGVSILDLLFNCGPESRYYIWGWRET